MLEKQWAAARKRRQPPNKLKILSFMGKKRIIQQSEEELIKEREKVDAATKKEVKIKPSKKITEGRVYISASYNNTIITLTDIRGNVLAWVSAGNIGFKGAKKATPFAASKTAEALSQRAKKRGMEKIAIFINGVGAGRDSALRSLANKGFDIVSIKDVTPIPHNGCRPPKVRRV
jgi:small subunit ribosomal protein S11